MRKSMIERPIRGRQRFLLVVTGVIGIVVVAAVGVVLMTVLDG
jgi:NhaP-type Na+/H+ or K+/H+ antiporter